MSQSNTGYPQDVDSFKRIVNKFQVSANFRKPLLFSIGRRVFTGNGTLASVRYPVVNGPDQNLGTAAVLMKVLDVVPEGVQNINLSRNQIWEALKYFAPFKDDGKHHSNIDVLTRVLSALPLDGRMPSSKIIATFIFDDINPSGVEDSTLKLYGMSNCHFKPNTLNLTKVFTKLPNVAWIGDTPMDADEVELSLVLAAFGGNMSYAPHMVDKFPLYIHRINALKMGVRITDQHKVRLGAYLGEGTTLMPGASYINFNAGTDGASMVEGRISSSAFVGAGTDIGGGAAILGTLSGGNNVPISIGRNCLLEVNSALGIPIGDAVIIAAETAVMSSTKVVIRVEGHSKYGYAVKAGDLAGINAVTFRRDSLSGEVQVVRTSRNIAFAKKLSDGELILNADLHKN